VIRLASASVLRLVDTTVGATKSIVKTMELLVVLYRVPWGNVQRWYDWLRLVHYDWLVPLLGQQRRLRNQWSCWWRCIVPLGGTYNGGTTVWC